MQEVKLGRIGLGLRSVKSEYSDMELFNNIEGCRLSALCDINEEVLNANTEKYKLPGYKNITEMIEKESLDAVFIRTPNNMHKENVIEALNADVHVMCEKPLATNLSDCDEMIAASKRRGKFLQVSLQRRFSVGMQKVKAIIDCGKLGKIRMIWCKEFRGPFFAGYDNFRMRLHSSGGAFVEKSCHHFDLFNWFSNSKVARIFAVGGNEIIYPNEEISDHGWIISEYENGVKCMFGLCLFCTTKRHKEEIGIIGDKGKLEFFHTVNENGKSRFFLEYQDFEGKEDSTTEIFPVIPVGKKGGQSHPGLLNLYSDFIGNIRTKTQPQINASVGKESLIGPIGAEYSIREKKVLSREEIISLNGF